MNWCSSCKISKESELFSKNKSTIDGLQNVCKVCAKKYRKQNIEYQKIYRERHSDKRKATHREYYKKNDDYLKRYAKKYRDENQSLIKENSQKFRDKNRKTLNAWHRNNYLNNKEKIFIKNESYRKTGLFKIIRSAYYKKRIKDPLYKLQITIRNRMGIAIKRQNISKISSTSKILGCDFDMLKQHLQSQFTNGMTWENHGQYGWHVDHIIPLASAKTENELIKLFHYTNLQPLWWRENIIKNSKIIAA